MNLQSSIDILQNRHWDLIHQRDFCCIYSYRHQHLVLPVKSVGKIPSGTLDAMFRLPYTYKESASRRNGQSPTIHVILEKQNSQFWGRVEWQGMMAIASGTTVDAVTRKLSAQLNEFATYARTEYNDQSAIPADFVFDYHYDLTRVRELLQQVKITSLLDQTTISPDLHSKFMTNKQYPSSQQARQIELLIQKFGKELLDFSLL